MRYPILTHVATALTFLLTISFLSSASPTNNGRHERWISSRHVLLRSPDRFISSPGGNRHHRHKGDMLTSSSDLSPALLQLHAHIMEHLQLHSGGSDLAKRSLAGDLTIMGFKLIWDNADVIVATALAYYRTTEYYAEIKRIAGGEIGFGPTVQNFAFTYGSFRLIFEPVAEAVVVMAAEIAKEFPDGIGQFVQDFVDVMLTLTAGVIIGTYRVLAWTAVAAIWITMVIVENAELRNLADDPLLN